MGKQYLTTKCCMDAVRTSASLWFSVVWLTDWFETCEAGGVRVIWSWGAPATSPLTAVSDLAVVVIIAAALPVVLFGQVRGVHVQLT